MVNNLAEQVEREIKRHASYRPSSSDDGAKKLPSVAALRQQFKLIRNICDVFQFHSTAIPIQTLHILRKLMQNIQRALYR